MGDVQRKTGYVEGGCAERKKIGGVKKLVAVKKIIQRECVVSAPFLLLDRR